MVPTGYAAPNAALNATITRGSALTKKLNTLGIEGVKLSINPVGLGAYTPPDGTITVEFAKSQGLTPDDLAHFVFTYQGAGDMQPEVAVIEKLLAPGTVSAVTDLFVGLFPSLTPAQTSAKALTGIANIPAVALALKTALT